MTHTVPNTRPRDKIKRVVVRMTELEARALILRGHDGVELKDLPPLLRALKKVNVALKGTAT